MASYDSMGIRRGKCTKCSCSIFQRVPDGVRCSCQHTPVAHVNVDECETASAVHAHSSHAGASPQAPFRSLLDDGDNDNGARNSAYGAERQSFSRSAPSPSSHSASHYSPPAARKAPHNLSPILFYRRGEPYFEFTNFYAGKPIVIDGLSWPTSEHYFQAMKFPDTALSTREHVRSAPTVSEAVARARKQDPSLVVRGWRTRKMVVMKRALFEKFCDPSLRQVLLDTHDDKLVEDSPTDAFWGGGADGRGENQMGKMLMEVRKVLRERREGEEMGRLDKILAQYVQEDREREEQEYSEKRRALESEIRRLEQHETE